MEKQNKYYTPDISEFHLDFEFEVLNPAQDHPDYQGWIKDIYKDGSTVKHLLKNKIRVKYLDKEDIESLGFEYSTTINQYDEFKFKFREELTLRKHIQEKNRIDIVYQGFNRYWFTGKILNKSELKKLMKQLNINV